MGYYSGRFIVKNETTIDDIKRIKKHGQVAIFKFSVYVNKTQLFLNNTLLEQILESHVIKNFILEDITKLLKENNELIENNIKNTCTISDAIAKKNCIGKYFFFNIYGGVNNSMNDLIESVSNLLKKKKSIKDILKG